MRKLLIAIFVLVSTLPLFAQSKADVADGLTSALSHNYLDKINNKISALNNCIANKTAKTLRLLEKQERKIQKKLAAKDSMAVQQLFSEKDIYQTLQQRLKKPLNNTGLKEYLPEFDSLKTSLDFLSHFRRAYLKNAKGMERQAKECTF